MNRTSIRESRASDGHGSLIYVDGELLSGADAKISVLDHSVLYGDGIFETFRLIDGHLFRLDAHLDRLAQSAAGIRLELPLARSEIAGAVTEVIVANGLENSYVKLVVTRGAGSDPVIGHRDLRPSLIIIARPSMPLLPGRPQGEGISAAIVRTRKTPAAALDPRIKSLNYLNVISARIDAEAAGADEAIMLDESGRVVEGSIYNLIVVNGRKLSTPASGCLEGITLDTVLRGAHQRGLAVERTELYPLDLRCADELIFTSTGVGVMAVHHLDGAPIGGGRPGPIYKELADLYADALTHPAYLTPAFHAEVASARGDERVHS